MPQFFEDYQVGAEAALEFRIYLESEDMNGPFIGLYAGPGYMSIPDNNDYEGIFTFGCKVGSKKILYVRDPDSAFFNLAIEPYVSAAMTVNTTRYGNSVFSHPDKWAFWLNIGFRFVIVNQF